MNGNRTGPRSPIAEEALETLSDNVHSIELAWHVLIGHVSITRITCLRLHVLPVLRLHRLLRISPVGLLIAVTKRLLAGGAGIALREGICRAGGPTVRATAVAVAALLTIV